MRCFPSHTAQHNTNHTGGRGPSAGREWFWLLNNTRLSPGHLLPRPAAAAPDVSLSAAAVAASNRAWRSEAGVWWEEGWSLGAVPLHYWPAHRERLRALAVDPWERWVVTAGVLVTHQWCICFEGAVGGGGLIKEMPQQRHLACRLLTHAPPSRASIVHSLTSQHIPVLLRKMLCFVVIVATNRPWWSA